MKQLPREESTITIAASATESSVLDVENGLTTTPVAIIVPTLTGTTITVHGGTNATNIAAIKDADGTNYTLAGSGNFWLHPHKLAGFRCIRFVSNATEAAERTLTVLSRPI